MKTMDSPAMMELRKLALQNRTPINVSFELTGRCNFDCKMCYVHVMDERAAFDRELSTKQWIRIMDEAYDAGMLFALLSGGECLIRKDFRELYLHLYNKGVKVRVNTNATLLNEEYLSFFRQYPPEQIQVTLYGSCDDVYEAVTGQRKFETVKQNIFLLRDSGLDYQVVCTPNRFLFSDYQNILKFIVDNQIHTLFANDVALLNVREAQSREPYDLTVDEQIEILRIRREVFGKRIFVNSDIPAPCGDCSQPVQYGSPCKAGRSSAAVSWEGVLQPCLLFADIGISLSDHSFADAWNELKIQCDKIAQPVECVGCAYDKICKICPLVRADGIYSGHRNKEACDFAVGQLKAGIVRLPQK